MSYPQTYPQVDEGNKGTERKKTEFRYRGWAGTKGTEYPPPFYRRGGSVLCYQREILYLSA